MLVSEKETLEPSTKSGAELRRHIIGLKNQEKNIEVMIGHLKGILRAIQQIEQR